MKIAIIGSGTMGGGYVRVMAYRNFLESRNHQVDLIQFPEKNLRSKICYYRLRAHARLQDHEKRLLKNIADEMEKRIRREKYDVVIGVEIPFSYVLTRELDCLKLFSCETLESDELYFSKKFGALERIHSLREMELDVLRNSDYVIFPWETTETYVRKYIWDGDNFVTIKYGCYPQRKTASYFFPLSIVSLGSLWGHWTNKQLLSYLTQISPYSIHIYGRVRPSRKYHLNYKGFAPSLDIFYNYQFGLETVSRNIFRLHSSRIMGYLAYGLPALSPDWMRFSHELKGVLPYNEDNFLDILEEHSDRDQWEKLSKEAHEQARELDWRITLEPLGKLIEK